jgi:acetylglutamate kinase
MSELMVIKIGGNIIDDDRKLHHFLDEFTDIRQNKILVHGGGKLATRLAEKLGIEQEMVDGRRVTDEETLKVVIMVYAGLINKSIVAYLQSRGCNAVGICGADGDAISAHKRAKGKIDYGFAGDIDEVNTSFLARLLREGNDIVVAPITHDKKGQLLNTNADTIAQELATALSAQFEVSLIYGFEKAGVLLNAQDDNTRIPSLTRSSYESLKKENVIFAGMIPKLDNAFQALTQGVSRVIIGNAEHLHLLIHGKTGTVIQMENASNP